VQTFRAGDLAVYPAHGVGLIEAVESKSLGGTCEDCYVMRILENNLTILIPTRNADNIGLRSIIGPEEVNSILAILEDKATPAVSQTWNRRYRGYMDKIKTGSVYEVAEVFRELTLIKGDRELSFGERKVLDVASSLLIKELSVAQKAEERVVAEQIEGIFG